MKLKEAVQILKDHNIWRRYDGTFKDQPKMADVKKLGIAIDTVVEQFENDDIVTKEALLSHLQALTTKIEDSHGYGFEDVLEDYIETALSQTNQFPLTDGVETSFCTCKERVGYWIDVDLAKRCDGCDLFLSTLL